MSLHIHSDHTPLQQQHPLLWEMTNTLCPVSIIPLDHPVVITYIP